MAAVEDAISLDSVEDAISLDSEEDADSPVASVMCNKMSNVKMFYYW